MAARKSRLADFRQLLCQDEIDIKKLRELCFQGCPEEEGVRANCWKLLLGYLPISTKKWGDVLDSQRRLYHQLMDEILYNPHTHEDGTSGEMVDHPLNPDPTSPWKRYFEDNEILHQIDNDTRRLYPDMSFFQLPTPYPRANFSASIEALKQRVERNCLPSQKVATSRTGIRNVSGSAKNSAGTDVLEPYYPLKEGEEAHWEVVERILFLYAKTNKGIGYVQGMNEVLGPIYYVFAQHPDPKWKEHAEADSFFCFTNLMTEVGDKFTKKLDFSHTGIGGAMGQMMKLLKEKDPVLHKHLQSVGMDPTFFGFRWITLLLSQEFLLPEVIRIWDSLFADDKRFDFLIFLCAAMIMSIRSRLLEGDFSDCMQLLQNYPLSDTQPLILQAQDLHRFHKL